MVLGTGVKECQGKHYEICVGLYFMWEGKLSVKMPFIDRLIIMEKKRREEMN